MECFIGFNSTNQGIGSTGGQKLGQLCLVNPSLANLLMMLNGMGEVLIHAFAADFFSG